MAAALKLKGVAEAARAREETARKRLEVFEYGRTVQAAHQEWRDIDVAGARALLDGTKPGLRGWEWRYVHRRCHAARLTIRPTRGYVKATAFSPDGTRIATACPDGVQVWDARTGKQLVAMAEGIGPVLSAVFSPTGDRVVAASVYGKAGVWDARTGKQLLARTGHAGQVHTAAFDPRGERVVTAGDDQTARLWDTRAGVQTLVLRGHTSQVACAAFSPDGTQVVTGSGDGTARVGRDPRAGRRPDRNQRERHGVHPGCRPGRHARLREARVVGRPNRE